MFICSQCPKMFSVEDVKNGDYFPSTGICAECYKKMAKTKLRCFGKKKMYDPKSLACGLICEDEKICKAFIRYRTQF